MPDATGTLHSQPNQPRLLRDSRREPDGRRGGNQKGVPTTGQAIPSRRQPRHRHHGEIPRDQPRLRSAPQPRSQAQVRYVRRAGTGHVGRLRLGSFLALWSGGGFAQEVDLGDIFDSFFGAGMGGMGGTRARTRTRGPVVGDDLRFDLQIDFKTAVFGGEEKVRIRHMETCDTCTGTGVKPGSKVTTCGTCNGTGVTVQVTRTPLGNFQTQQTCPTCRGTGRIVEEYCGTCGGQGVNQKTKQIKVTIPAGVENGNKLRVRGEGDAGPNGGPPGDLYIFLQVKPDPMFRREGSEIYSDHSISYLDAILGASVKCPVVDGEVTIKIPPGTQPGQVMRLKGNGAPRLGQPDARGDHYVTVNIEIPKDLTKEEEELMQKLKRLQDAKGTKKKGGIFG